MLIMPHMIYTKKSEKKFLAMQPIQKIRTEFWKNSGVNYPNTSAKADMTRHYSIITLGICPSMKKKESPICKSVSAGILTFMMHRRRLPPTTAETANWKKQDGSWKKYIRSYATLELVEGNLAQGLDYASQAYAIYPEGDYVIDTYIVALAANGMMEEAQRLVEQYEKDYMFDDDLYDFLDGNMTLEEYYIG